MSHGRSVSYGRTPIPGAVAGSVWTRDAGSCQKCLRTKTLHEHHIVAVQDGGRNDVENITLLCGECHLEWHRYHDLQGTPFADWVTQVPLRYQDYALKADLAREEDNELPLQQSLSDIQEAWTKSRSMVLSWRREDTRQRQKEYASIAREEQSRNEDKAHVLSALSEGDNTINGLSDALSIERTRMRSLLKSMESSCKVKRVGHNGRHAIYRLTT